MFPALLTACFGAPSHCSATPVLSWLCTCLHLPSHKPQESSHFPGFWMLSQLVLHLPQHLLVPQLNGLNWSAKNPAGWGEQGWDWMEKIPGVIDPVGFPIYFTIAQAFNTTQEHKACLMATEIRCWSFEKVYLNEFSLAFSLQVIKSLFLASVVTLCIFSWTFILVLLFLEGKQIYLQLSSTSKRVFVCCCYVCGTYQNRAGLSSVNSVYL